MSEWAKIAELADTNPESLPANTDQSFGFGYIDLGSVDDGTIDWPRVQYVSFKDAPSRARRVCISGDALFGTVRPNLQSHGYVPDGQRAPLVASTGFTVIRAHKNVADGRYIFFSLLSKNILRQSINAAVGSNYPAVTDRDVRQFRLFAPPIEQQSKIADVLASLDTQIQKTEALIAKLEKVKEGLLHDLLTRGIDERGQLRPSPDQAPELYKESPLGLIPRKWGILSLGELSTSSVIGPFGSDLVASDYRSEGVPVVFVRDVVSKMFTWKSEVYVDHQKAASLSAHDVVAGDVLLTKMGLPPCIACTYPGDFPEGVVTADIVRLRPKRSTALPEWVSNYANSEYVAAQVRGITSGVTRPKVTLSDVRSLKIAVPPLEDQDAILHRVSEASRRVNAAHASLGKLVSEKAGLMDDLLTGRVRVTPLLDQAKNQAQATPPA